MSRLPTIAEIIDLERSQPGTEYGNKGYDERFLNRMKKCGYLDSAARRTSRLERLRIQYDSDGLVLFLGAGVSKPSGIPEWRELIDLMLKALDFGPAPENASSFSRLLEEKASLSLLSQFDLVSHQCKGTDQSEGFVDLLRAHLYGDAKFQEVRRLMNDMPVKKEQKKLFDWEPLLTELRKNTTLAAVGELLLDQNGGEVKVNPNIGAVLTTNADNLLQAYVMCRAGGRRLLTTVDRASVRDHPRMISVYHLHGWLDVRDRRELAVATPALVFRESEYFDSMANPNAFANYTAQSLFQRRNVLFIGTSMEDVNVRRWLYNSFEERRRHRAQLLEPRYGDYPAAEAEAYAASIRHFWFKRAKDLPEPRKVIQDSMADAMRHLGVEVIWYEEHSEIADHLRMLSQSPKSAEDIVQECFLAVLDGTRFDAKQGSMRTYLFGITRNLALKRVRTAQRESEEMEDAEAAFDQLDDLLSAERSEIVGRAVSALPPLQREALILFEYEGLSLEEIAEVTGTEVGAVKARLHRAREALRRHLAPLFAERAPGRWS